MGQPTQRATNYTARSNIDTDTHSHELPAQTALAQHISHSHSGIDEKRPTEKFVVYPRATPPHTRTARAPPPAAHRARIAASHAPTTADTGNTVPQRANPWPLQEIRLRRGCCARINYPFIPPVHPHCPPWCNIFTRLLDSIRLFFRSPVRMLYTIQYW